ncbi:MAG TPA: GH3 auxin-responsive promoter family protein, partial [bacterium]|nr:GH3 auxin-responsive promoter family protein [bacterium]
SSILDEELKKLNSDYEAKRYQDLNLLPPLVIRARSGLFYDWLKSRQRLGGQAKIPRLSNDRQVFDSLLALNQ